MNYFKTKNEATEVQDYLQKIGNGKYIKEFCIVHKKDDVIIIAIKSIPMSDLIKKNNEYEKTDLSEKEINEVVENDYSEFIGERSLFKKQTVLEKGTLSSL